MFLDPVLELCNCVFDAGVVQLRAVTIAVECVLHVLQRRLGSTEAKRKDEERETPS